MGEDAGFAVEAGLQIGEAGLGLAGERDAAAVTGVEAPESGEKGGEGEEELDQLFQEEQAGESSDARGPDRL